MTLAGRTLPWLAVLICHAWFVHFWPTTLTANEAVRLFFVQAQIDHGVAALDPVFARYGLTVADAVPFEGRWYMDKAPGLPWAVGPLYWLLTRALGWSTALADLPLLHHTLTLAGVTLPALGGALAVRRLVQAWTGDDTAARTAAIALALATPYGLYAGLFFGHAPAAALGALALLAADRGHFKACGAAGGAMVLVDTATAPWAALLGLYGAATHRSWRGVLSCAAAGAPFIAVQLAYNHALFGSPLTFAYAFKAIPSFKEIHDQGLYGFGWPSLHALGGILISPSRGLYFFGPALAFGLWGLWQRPRGRQLLAAIALFTAWIGGFNGWHAGESLGPRHLLPIAPALAVGLGDALHRLRGGPALGLRVALAWGVCTTWLSAATWPYAPEPFHHPLSQLAWPLLRDGHHAPSLLWGATVAPPALALIPLALAGATLASLDHRRGPWALAVPTTLALAALLNAATPPPPPPVAALRARIICLMGDRPAGRAHCRAIGGTPKLDLCECGPPTAPPAPTAPTSTQPMKINQK